jgi:hypothetical protein
MSLFNPSRDEVREFFFTTWSKYKSQESLTEMEKIAISIIHMHPEYYEFLDAPDKFKQQDYLPEFGESNPFLHMSLHISILEQISINQPIGISSIYETLKKKHHHSQKVESEHFAQHDMLECLAETIWLAQRNNTGLDTEHYLQLLKLKAI